MHILIASYNISLKGYKSVRAVDDIDELLEVETVEDVFYHVTDDNRFNIDIVIRLIAYTSKVKNIYIVDHSGRLKHNLQIFGFKFCGVYTEEYIETYDSFDFVRSTSNLSVIGDNQKAINYLLRNIDDLKLAMGQLIKVCNGDIGLMEMTDYEKRCCKQSGYLLNEIYGFMKSYKDGLNDNDNIESVIKLIGDTLYNSKKGYHSELSHSNELRLQLEDLNRSYENLKFDHDLYKESSKIFLFPTTYNVTKRTGTKVFYIREYSHCTYLLSMLFNFRLFLTGSNRSYRTLLVVCFHNVGLHEKRTLSRKGITLLNTVDNVNSVQELNKVPIAYMSEQNSGVWDALLDSDLTHIIVLDRFYSDNPILRVENKVGLELSAVSSSKDIDLFNLDKNKVIMGIEGNGRHIIPHIEGYSGASAGTQLTMYISNMGSTFREWQRGLKK